MRAHWLALGLFILTAAPAAAEGWTVMDLGEVKKREDCMNRAEDVLGRYMRVFGGDSVDSDSWTHYGYDFKPGDNDVVIMCPVVAGGKINAFLTIHGESDDEQRVQVGEQIERYWNE